MSKVILVLNDMPSNCVECPLADRDRILEICSITGNEIDNITYEGKEELEKNKDCPLKELPKKQIIDIETTKDSEHYYTLGFNDCIDEILGEAKHND